MKNIRTTPDKNSHHHSLPQKSFKKVILSSLKCEETKTQTNHNITKYQESTNKQSKTRTMTHKFEQSGFDHGWTRTRVIRSKDCPKNVQKLFNKHYEQAHKANHKETQTNAETKRTTTHKQNAQKTVFFVVLFCVASFVSGVVLCLCFLCSFVVEKKRTDVHTSNVSTDRNSSNGGTVDHCTPGKDIV